MLKSVREKEQVTYKGNPIWSTADLSAETLQARKEWQDTFKVLKENKNKKQSYNQDYSTQKGFYSKFMEKSKALQESRS